MSPTILPDNQLPAELLAWFYSHRENYFFRQNRTPYRVWVSEVALQQTRIQAALGPLQRFFDRFPDLQSLACSHEEEVLQHFAGLGYYNRARNLLKGARYIAENFPLGLPDNYQQLLQVPSIGPYTAAAIASICFGQKVAVIDGNVKRVTARLWQIEQAIDSQSFSDQIQSRLQTIMQSPALPAGDFNEAIMELGQKICLVKTPLCLRCPLQKFCQAYKNNTSDKLPITAKSQEKIEVTWYLHIIETPRGQICLHNYRDFYFLKQMTGFYSMVEIGKNGQKIYSADNQDIQKELLEQSQKAKAIATFRHTITRHKIEAIVVKSKLSHQAQDCLAVAPREVNNLLAASILKKAWSAFSEKL